MEHAVNRSVLTTNFGENFLRHTVRIESDPCEEGDFRALVTLLRMVTGDSPDLLRHAGPCPTEGGFLYESGRWVLKSVTVVPREPDRE
jgi:hypothetical protein